ncbi:MAG: class I SAM-dependent methyltransferase [candidate division KSB1 bacterium]|nr:class I SAM-dependent methyltransferase [candidate division KSB1 bacterium]
MRTPLRLLPKNALVRTGPVDHADWNFRPLLGFIQRQRFRLCRKLLQEIDSGPVLEIGYGSGIFLPELTHITAPVMGADVHQFAAAVRAVLRGEGVKAHLVRASAENIPFLDASFQAVVAISALEFVPDLSRACREIRRVLKPSGALVVVTPGASPLIDLGFRLLTGVNPAQDFGNRREMICGCLLEHFTLDKELRFPPGVGRSLRLYRAMRLRPLPLPPGTSIHYVPSKMAQVASTP